MSKALSNDKKKADEHLTVKTCIGANPLISRYINFARLVLAVCEKADHAGQKVPPDTFNHICQSFFLQEELFQKKAKPKATKEKKSDKKDEKSVKTKAETVKVVPGRAEVINMMKKVLPVNAHVPDGVGFDADKRSLVKETQPLSDKLLNHYATIILDRMTLREQKTLKRILETQREDAKWLNSEEFRKTRDAALKELNFTGDRTDEKFLAYADEQFERSPVDFWKTRVNPLAVKQYLALKKENKLLPPTHLKSAVQLYHKLSEMQISADQPATLLLEKMAQVNGTAVERLSYSDPVWKNAVNLGRIHPRIIALQLIDGGETELLEDFTTSCDSFLFLPILVPKKPDAIDDRFDPTPSGGTVEQITADSPTMGRQLTVTTQPIPKNKGIRRLTASKAELEKSGAGTG